MKRGNKLLFLGLFFILLISGVLRFWNLSEYPIHLTIDEVAIGYNAYSILKTGRDEHGSFLPLAFKSTGDWKPPVLVYLMVPSVALFGLNEFGVRFPMALVGTITPFVVFLLIKKLSNNLLLSFLTAFSLAISPWHIHYSRASFEAVVALFFLLLGTLFFLEGKEGRKGLFLLSIIFLVLSMYAYHAERIFTPIFFLMLVFLYRKEVFSLGKNLILFLGIGFLFFLPLLLMMLDPRGQTRAKMTFISQDIEISRELHLPEEKLSLTQKILDNNLLILGNFWIKRYLNYWDPRFIFFKGMKLTLPDCPDIGILHLFEIPFFIVGVLVFFFGKEKFISAAGKKLIIFWLLLGPFPASLANNDQHTLRSLTTIPAFQFLIGVGLYFVWEKWVKNSIVRKILAGAIMFLMFIFSLFYYFDLYYIHHPFQFSEYYDYGYKEMSLFAWENQTKFERIIVDYNFGSLGPYLTGVPHLYILFYGKYDPASYQNRPNLNSNDFANFYFRPINWREDSNLKNTLFIGSPWSLPLDGIKEEQILKKVYFKNGNLGFLAVKNLE